MWFGNEANQCALANKLHHAFKVHAIVKETRIRKKKRTWSKLAEAMAERIFMPSLGRAWRNLQDTCMEQYPNWPAVKTLDTQSINSEEVFQFTKDQKPDLILVSGTALVKENMFSIPVEIGIMNLHTGLSPYVKGGPNCTNWCLAEKQFHLIGNTIMWLNRGIDTGDIVTTACVPLDHIETLSALHLRVMNHAHELYQAAVEFVGSGNRPAYKQDAIETGRTYYTRQWVWKKKWAASRNFNLLLKKEQLDLIKQKQKKIVQIPLQ